RYDAAADGEGNAGHRDKAVAQRIEEAVEQEQDQQEGDRHDDVKPFLRLLQIFEFARPKDRIPRRQLDRLVHTLLRLSDRAAEVATAHAEFDRHVTLAAVAINEGSA